ncbi:serine hydrolase domain-containing protein [uncultured Microbulbifer sp.]|uniref:serine hydrolase domain-containing protein n=1 Tax=uncultured Microbulbifer sp. TaxID=348147 RepID=UPI00262F2B9E|nr:serine hydrolase domain-containing protein [uncultured Microbulbifer sp.]
MSRDYVIKTLIKMCFVMVFLDCELSFSAQSSNNMKLRGEVENEDVFSAILAKKRRETGLVSLAAMATKNGSIVFSSAVGERKKGSGVAVTDAEKWHIGSITKSITATMIARLIEDGKLAWKTRVKDVFQEYPDIHEAWLDVTVEQLLTATSGAKENFSFYTTFFTAPAHGDSERKLREIEVLRVLRNRPKNIAGTKYLYSNVGYVIASVIAEKVTDKSWKQLVAKEVFIPLNLGSAGFGHPNGDQERLAQPVGHRRLLGFFVPGSEMSPVVDPAGAVHMTLRDLTLYANDHLQGELGAGKLLKAKTYRKLHTVKLENYAFGWAKRVENDWFNGAIYWHNGSDTMWYALLVFEPTSNVVVAVASNDGDFATAEKSAWEIVEFCFRHIGGKLY